MGENKTKCIVRRLRQDKIIRESLTNGNNPWTGLSDSWKTEDGNSVGRYVVLAHPSERKTILERSAWNLSKGDGLPGFVEQSSSDNDESIEYVRYSQCPEGLEPLLIQQDFGNVVPSVMHVSEEFRLLMNLWRDIRTCNYFEIKKMVQKISPFGSMAIRLKCVLRYLNATRPLVNSTLCCSPMRMLILVAIKQKKIFLNSEQKRRKNFTLIYAN